MDDRQLLKMLNMLKWFKINAFKLTINSGLCGPTIDFLTVVGLIAKSKDAIEVLCLVGVPSNISSFNPISFVISLS